MNCKPGDLAVIVNEESGCLENIGRFVTVDEPGEKLGEWCVTPVSGSLTVRFVHGDNHYRAYSGDTIWMPDAYLRPIRDHGEDAVDETLQWLPAPKQTEEA